MLIIYIHYLMLKLLPCLQRVFQFFTTRTNYQIKLNSKRYADVESCGNEYYSPSESIQSSQLKFVDQQNNDVFMSPDVEAQVQQISLSNVLINQCTNSTYQILQILENAYIDSSQNCTIFLGPCKSTVFIRNCKNLKIKTITQQLRIENSTNIIIEAIVGVKPVIQECRQIKLCSLECLIYEDLIWQMQLAKTNAFHNKIFECYDFTPLKVANFQIESPQIDQNWINRLKQNNLLSKGQQLYFPTLLPMKSSIVKKMLAEKQLQKEESIVGLVGAFAKRQLIHVFNQLKITGDYSIIFSLDEQRGMSIFGKSELQLNKQANENIYYICIKCGNQSVASKLKSFKSAKCRLFIEEIELQKFLTALN